MLTVLAVIVPLGFFASIFGRKSIPAESDLPLTRSPYSADLLGQPAPLTSQWQGADISTQLFQAADSSSRNFLQITPQNHLKHPQLLLYWLSVQKQNLTELPGEAVLLGRMANTGTSIFRLPQHAEQKATLIVYSLPQQRIVATARLDFQPRDGGE